MARHDTPLGVKLLLFFLFLIGLALNVLVILDVTWLHLYLEPRGSTATTVQDSEVDELRKSIVLVRVPTCDGSGVGNGTGFVVKPGFVATASHVIADHYACGSEIRLVDSFGVEHRAFADGYSDADDLALLRINATAIPQLTLADSRQYQEISEVVEVVTIGYPLVGAASAYNSAAVSGEGTLSRFDPGNNRFVTSGLNVNPGNSGGPVFLRESWTVVGVASAKMDVTIGEGIGYVIPINIFKQFFFDTTGETLE